MLGRLEGGRRRRGTVVWGGDGERTLGGRPHRGCPVGDTGGSRARPIGHMRVIYIASPYTHSDPAVRQQRVEDVLAPLAPAPTPC